MNGARTAPTTFTTALMIPKSPALSFSFLIFFAMSSNRLARAWELVFRLAGDLCCVATRLLKGLDACRGQIAKSRRVSQPQPRAVDVLRGSLRLNLGDPHSEVRDLCVDVRHPLVDTG